MCYAEGNAYGPYEDEPMLGVSEFSIYNGWDLAVNYIGEGGGVSPFISFAKKLRKTLNYPIGLIPRAVGGSPISTWVKGGDHMKKLRREVEKLRAENAYLKKLRDLRNQGHG